MDHKLTTGETNSTIHSYSSLCCNLDICMYENHRRSAQYAHVRNMRKKNIHNKMSFTEKTLPVYLP